MEQTRATKGSNFENAIAEMNSLNRCEKLLCDRYPLANKAKLNQRGKPSNQLSNLTEFLVRFLLLLL